MIPSILHESPASSAASHVVQETNARRPTWLERSRQVADIVSIKQAAAILSMSRATIRELRDNGEIKDHGAGPQGARLVSVAEIRATPQRKREAFEQLDAEEAPRSTSGRRVRGPDKRPRRPRRRRCEACGVWFTPARKRSDRKGRFCSLECYRTRNGPRLEPRECAREGCDVVFTPDSRDDPGRYCSKACEHPPVLVSCFVCHESFRRSPSQVARSRRERRRQFCDVCAPVFKTALSSARLGAHYAARNADALRLALEAGREADARLRELRPQRVGWPRRRSIERAIAIEVLFVTRELTDGAIRQLLRAELGELNHRYVEVLRQRAQIRRRAA